MGRWSKWIVDSSRPTPVEVESLQHPVAPEVLAEVRRVSAPTEDEVQRLLRARRAVMPAPEAGRAWGRWALAATACAAAAAVWVALPAAGPDPLPYGAIEVALAAPVALGEAQVIELGPSIDVSGAAQLRVDQADIQGTRVAVLDGTARFDVDPAGAYRALVVSAGGVEVEVKGTIFDVGYVDGRVHVGVERGRVEVREGGRAFFLTAGEHWASAEIAAAQTPSLEPAIPLAITAPFEAAPLAAPAQSQATASAPPRSAGPASAQVAVSPSEAPQATPAPEAPSIAAASANEAKNTMPVFSRLRARYEGGDRTEALGTELGRWLESADATDPRRQDAIAMRLVVVAHHRPNAEVAASLWDYAERRPGSIWQADLLTEHARVTHRELRDCGSAVRSYARLEALSAGQDQARARAGLGLCLLETGDRKGATHALEAALGAGLPQGALRHEVEAACASIRGCVIPR